MKWLWKWLSRKVNYHGSDCIVREAPRRYGDGPKTISFQVTLARGGFIISASHYDKKTDREESVVQIIPETADFGEMVADFARMELMR